jgi:hypothetical protein
MKSIFFDQKTLFKTGPRFSGKAGVPVEGLETAKVIITAHSR